MGILPAVLLLLAGCARTGDEVRGEPRVGAEPAPARPAPVESQDPPKTRTAVAVPVQPSETARSLTIDTTLVVDQDVTLMARMSGTVDEILCDRGSRVRKGDVLLKLMNRDLELQLRKAEITAKQKRAEFERARQLHAEYTLSESQYEDVSFALEGADVEVEIAREELLKSLIRAPFDGVIVDRFARLGQKVVEDNDEPLFRLTALAPLQARLYLPEDVARTLRQGDKVEVRSRLQRDVSVTGTIEWIARVVDASSGTCQALVSVPGTGRHPALEPGAAVNVLLSLPARDAAVLIPPAAIEGGPGAGLQRMVRVEVLEDGKRSWRNVRLGEMRGDRVEILEGLRAGESVVLNRAADEPTGDRR